jgi:hypothetical protein
MRAHRLVLVLVVLATASSSAFAQSASVQAQSLFDEGRKLLQAGKIAEACAAFESSQKLDPAVTTLLNLADCREQNHQLATAWGAFVEANRMARASNNAKLARVATNHAQKLEPRLSKITINIPADRQVPGLEILRDSEPVNPAVWNHAVPIDGGTYTITARAPGYAPWSATRTIKVESDAQAVGVPKLTAARPEAPVAVSRAGSPGGAPPAAPTPAGGVGGTPPVAKPVTAASGGVSASPATSAASQGAPPRAGPPAPSSRTVADAAPEPAVTPTVAPAPDRPEPRSESAHAHTLPLMIGAGALVVGGAALGFDLWGNSTYDKAKSEMQDQARRDDLYHSANTRRYLAEGFGVAALGCAGSAVYLYLRGRGEGRANPTAITPVASLQFSGLAVAGSW